MMDNYCANITHVAILGDDECSFYVTAIKYWLAGENVNEDDSDIVSIIKDIESLGVKHTAPNYFRNDRLSLDTNSKLRKFLSPLNYIKVVQYE